MADLATGTRTNPDSPPQRINSDRPEGPHPQHHALNYGLNNEFDFGVSIHVCESAIDADTGRPIDTLTQEQAEHEHGTDEAAHASA
jgi:hypothetical protein